MHTPQILKIGLISLGCLTIALPAHSQEFKAKTYTSLKSDGVDKGSNAYKLIRKAFGKKALESPDLYDSNHTDTAHIIEDEDAVIGPHFGIEILTPTVIKAKQIVNAMRSKSMTAHMIAKKAFRARPYNIVGNLKLMKALSFQKASPIFFKSNRKM